MELFSPKYVLDSGIIIDLKYYFNEVFTSLWERFDEMIKAGEIISSSEVFREIEKRDDDAKAIAIKYKKIFRKPEIAEQQYIKEILNNHPELIKSKNINNGYPVADPFVIAKAIYHKSILVTSESYKQNAHNIPNICNEYNIRCLSLRGFFKEEQWEF